MRVVVTLTTIPTREDSLVSTIQSIKAGTVQPDAIYVNIPEWYPRFRCKPDPNLEPKLKNMGVIVNRCPDYGVLTKLIPILNIETDPSTCIVIIDDDVNYQPKFLEGLVKGYEEFKCVVGYSGIAYPETMMARYGRLGYNLYLGHGTQAEMLECSFGHLIPRHAIDGFPTIEPMTEISDKHVYLSDDYLYAKYFDFKNIPKKVVCWPWVGRVGDDWSSIWTQNSGSQTHALSRDENNLNNFMIAGTMMKFARFVVTTLHTPDWEGFAAVTDAHKQKYCDRHGYAFETKGDGPWHTRIDLGVMGDWGFERGYRIIDMFKKYPTCEWVLFSDCDAMFTNHAVTLDRIADNRFHVILPADCNGTNCGNIMVRNSEIGRAFCASMIAARAAYRDNVMAENQWIQEMATATYWRKWIKIVPQRLLNAYDYTLYPDLPSTDVLGVDGQWKAGDFLVHIVGGSARFKKTLAQRIEIANKYLEKTAY